MFIPVAPIGARKPQSSIDSFHEHAHSWLCATPREHEPPSIDGPRGPPPRARARTGSPRLHVVVVLVLVLVLRGGSGAPTCTSSWIDRPCRGTFRGGTPLGQRLLRQHDPAEAKHGSALPRGPSAEHASVQRIPPVVIPVAPTSAREPQKSIDSFDEHAGSARTSASTSLRPAPPIRVRPRRSDQRAEAPVIHRLPRRARSPLSLRGPTPARASVQLLPPVFITNGGTPAIAF